MREFLFLIFLVAVHSSSHVNSQRKDITNRVSINSQMDVEYNDNNANNDQNDDTASTGYYYNYYYYGDDGSNDDAANDDQVNHSILHFLPFA